MLGALLKNIAPHFKNLCAPEGATHFGDNKNKHKRATTHVVITSKRKENASEWRIEDKSGLSLSVKGHHRRSQNWARIGIDSIFVTHLLN